MEEVRPWPTLDCSAVRFLMNKEGGLNIIMESLKNKHKDPT